MNNRTLGVNFSTRKEEYISCWFRSRRELSREELRFEAGGFGVPALYVRPEPDGSWLANFRLPPGLAPGWHDVRLRSAGSGFGRSFRIAVDLPVNAGVVAVQGACDGRAWTRGETSPGSFVSVWAAGLPDNADRANTIVRLDERPLPVDYVGAADDAGLRQVNAAVPAEIGAGEFGLSVECGGVRSQPWTMRVR
jgi:uncharacterized protein (TIGR03437 family)